MTDYDEQDDNIKDVDSLRESDFAREVGIELHEVIFFFQHLPDKAEFWNQIIGKDEGKITRSKELYKLIYALIFATMRVQHNFERKKAEELGEEILPIERPPSEPIKELTRIIKHKIKRGRECFSFTKIEYIKGFNNYLYQAAEQLNCVDPDQDSPNSEGSKN